MKHEPTKDGGGYCVKVYNNDIEKAIKILKKKITNDGLIREIKRRQAYEKPGDKRRREKAEAVRRHRKSQAMKRKFSN